MNVLIIIERYKYIFTCLIKYHHSVLIYYFSNNLFNKNFWIFGSISLTIPKYFLKMHKSSILNFLLFFCCSKKLINVSKPLIAFFTGIKGNSSSDDESLPFSHISSNW